MTKVMIMRGLPGSGKDTFLRSLARGSREYITVCSADDYFMVDGEYRFDFTKLTEAHNACFAKFVDRCSRDSFGTIAVSNTNTQLFEMSPYLMYAQYRKLPIEIFEVTLVKYKQFVHLELMERNIHGVPVEAIEGMDKRWENVPAYWPEPVQVRTLDGAFRILDSDGNTIETINAATEE